ncbi:plasmid mobilization relaxosome protein MobC [Allobranchiibius huperziae]|uniref:Bacterial mobilisation domain-containing protein n=1 Tax=Allobranchiibius huperziae TaxID=1874116 RepID=A0A853DG32_9MICO|nr:hypothetical protein [Allobranchiibius huperziae]
MSEREGVFRRRRTEGRRPHRTVIRHTDEEWARVQAMAQVQGVSVPRLYERALLAGDVVVASKLTSLREEMHGPRRLLANVANNLNQMARVANVSGEVATAQQLEAALHTLHQQVDRLNGLLEQVPGGPDL